MSNGHSSLAVKKFIIIPLGSLLNQAAYCLLLKFLIEYSSFCSPKKKFDEQEPVND